MNVSKNNTATEQVILTKPMSLNQKLNTHKKNITAKVIKANAAINESFDSNCFVLGYN
ncbi:MAG: hypothetical protein JKY19_09075 [Alcanivoracaceae bacterium]|nr:hypothetical protein [Alcanivoracaceae bacterium]